MIVAVISLSALAKDTSVTVPVHKSQPIEDIRVIDLRVKHPLGKKVDWVLSNMIKPNLENFEDGWQLTGYSWLTLSEDFSPKQLIKVGIISAELEYAESFMYLNEGNRCSWDDSPQGVKLGIAFVRSF